MTDKQIYKLQLYKPSGEYAGLLDVYNLSVNLSLEGFSSISFNIPAYIDGEKNKRADDVLDLYEVSLEIKNKKYRFILRSVPTTFDESGVRYLYEGISTESELDRKIIKSWKGAERNIAYFSSPFKVSGSLADPKTLIYFYFAIYQNSTWYSENFTKIGERIEVLEIRRDQDFETRTPLVYIEKSEFDNKRGTYTLEKDGSFVRLIIGQYSNEDVYIDVNSENITANENQLLSDSLAIFYTVILDPPFEAREDDEGYLLIGDASEKLNFDIEDAPTGHYETYYSEIGVTIEELLIDLLPNPWVFKIDGSIKDIKRSFFELNNISVYELLEKIKDSFGVVFIIDSEKREISFYKDYFDIEGIELNNIILKEGHYLKAIEKNLSTEKLATQVYGIGKDYITTGMFSPTGNSWIDFSYYLDEYWEWINEKNTMKIYLENFIAEREQIFINKNSKWMSKELAFKVAGYQLIRDVITAIYFGNKDMVGDSFDSIFYDNERPIAKTMYSAFNILEKREVFLENYTKRETKYLERKYKASQYDKLRKHASSKVEQGHENFEADLQRYRNLSLTYNEGLEKEKAILDLMEARLFETNLDKINDIINILQNDFNYNNYDEYYDINYAYILKENSDLLKNYFNFSQEEKKELEKFKLDFVLQDNNIVSSLDLLERIMEYTKENSKPEITLIIDIIDILAAQESDAADKDALFLGNYLYVDFPMFHLRDRVQIREMSIDFDSNSIDLTVSNMKNRPTGLLYKMVDRIRGFQTKDKNLFSYKQDEADQTKESAESANVIYNNNNLKEIKLSSEQAGMSIGDEGIVINDVKIDYDKEELVQVFDKERVIEISGGSILLKETNITSEGEEDFIISTSLDSGFSIKKILKYDDEREDKIENIFHIRRNESGFELESEKELTLFSESTDYILHSDFSPAQNSHSIVENPKADLLNPNIRKSFQDGFGTVQVVFKKDGLTKYDNEARDEIFESVKKYDIYNHDETFPEDLEIIESVSMGPAYIDHDDLEGNNVRREGFGITSSENLFLFSGKASKGEAYNKGGTIVMSGPNVEIRPSKKVLIGTEDIKMFAKSNIEIVPSNRFLVNAKDISMVAGSFTNLTLGEDYLGQDNFTLGSQIIKITSTDKIDIDSDNITIQTKENSGIIKIISTDKIDIDSDNITIQRNENSGIIMKSDENQIDNILIGSQIIGVSSAITFLNSAQGTYIEGSNISLTYRKNESITISEWDPVAEEITSVTLTVADILGLKALL